VDYVDIVEIHNSPAFKHTPDIPWGWMALSLEDYLGRKGALEGLENARRAGKVGFFGFGAPMESPNRARLDGVAKYRKLMRELMDIPVVRALFATGKFDLVNVEYNLINPTAGTPRPRGLDVDMDYGDIITLANSYSVGIAIFSPLAKGALTEATLAGAGHHPLARGTDNAMLLAAQASALRFLSRPGEQTLSEATYRFNLMHPGVTTLIGGFSATEQLEEAAGVSGSHGLTPQEMARVEMVWKANFGLPHGTD
jgi:L-glyceraldehyde 3-phosphate reductase